MRSGGQRGDGAASGARLAMDFRTVCRLSVFVPHSPRQERAWIQAHVKLKAHEPSHVSRSHDHALEVPTLFRCCFSRRSAQARGWSALVDGTPRKTSDCIYNALKAVLTLNKALKTLLTL